MSGWLELAIRYCVFHRWKTAIMVVCIFLTLFLPLVIKTLLDQFSLQVISRATATPFVVGAKGSGLDLTLHALYFKNAPRAASTYGEWKELTDSARCLAVPLFSRFSAQGYPVVGTSQDYFRFRELEFDSGRRFALLGECVIGWELANKLQIKPGDQLLSDRENLLDIAGLYPLKMNIVGVLRRQNSADDRTVFVDIKTAWVIQGLGHGHVDLANETDEGKILSRDSERIVASAAVLPYTEITDANRDSFHFHGDENTFPLTAIIVVPTDQRAADLLQADYDVAKEGSQMVQPLDVIQQLMDVVFKVKRFFDANALLVFASTGLLLILVILLSLKLRAEEMQTMFKLGCSRSTIALLQVGELAVVCLLSAMLLVVALWLTNTFAADIVEQLIVQSD